MTIRETTRKASEKATFEQRASAYHDYRHQSITAEGDHALAAGPHAIVHAIPQGALTPDDPGIGSLEKLNTFSLTGYTKEGVREEPTPTGRRIRPQEDQLQSYNEISDHGIVEAVSNRFVTTEDGQSTFDGEGFEAATTALGHWVAGEYADLDVERISIHATLRGLSDTELLVRARALRGRDEESHPFESPVVQPFGTEIEVGGSMHMQDTYEELRPLFDAIWSVVGLDASPYDGSGATHRYIPNLAQEFQ